ncbi:hypothetical protein AAFN85_25485 [Mucilaginibacter sp. CAU 1740]|uniref:hypothetical protein n=1 Tax=Mucilaginibacter sp. CAU 1740 TaxID=3140365 RepID=UPI00325B538A
MKILDKKLELGTLNRANARPLRAATFIGRSGCLILISVLFLSSLGCKKPAADEGSYYGYGRLAVTCAGECNVSFGSVGKMNNYTVTSTTAVYTFRYQTKYELGITITPVDKDQSLRMEVYSREEMQIFKNSVDRKVNEPWVAQILVP